MLGPETIYNLVDQSVIKNYGGRVVHQDFEFKKLLVPVIVKQEEWKVTNLPFMLYTDNVSACHVICAYAVDKSKNVWMGMLHSAYDFSVLWKEMKQKFVESGCEKITEVHVLGGDEDSTKSYLEKIKGVLIDENVLTICSGITKADNSYKMKVRMTVDDIAFEFYDK